MNRRLDIGTVDGLFRGSDEEMKDEDDVLISVAVEKCEKGSKLIDFLNDDNDQLLVQAAEENEAKRKVENFAKPLLLNSMAEVKKNKYRAKMIKRRQEMSKTFHFFWMILFFMS